MKHSILIISFALSLSSAFSQTMPMQIFVEIGDITSKKNIVVRGEEIPQINIFPVTVTQKIDVSTVSKDTLTLQLRHQNMLSLFVAEVLFQNLTIWGKSHNQDSIPINYFFSGIIEVVDGRIIVQPDSFTAGTFITVFLDEDIDWIIVRYNYTSDYYSKCRRFCFDEEGNTMGVLLYFQPQIYTWHSWYFTHYPLTELTKLQFSLPGDDSYIFFATQTKRIADSLYVTDLNRVEIEHGINFFLLKRDLYEEISFYNEYVTGRFLLPKGHTIDTEKITRETKYFLSQLNDFFDNENHISFHKIGADLRIEDGGDGLIWGNVTHTADGSTWILSDLSEINPIHHHEVIHLFFDNSLAEGDIAPFFFRESMIEYLAIFFANRHDAARRDSVFNARFAIYQGIERESLDAASIFDVEHNFYRMDGSLGGTSAIVYLRTPFKVHQLAKSVGEENFFNILRIFYHHVKREQRAGFSDFEKILKQNGVTDEQWLEFVTNL